MSLADFYPWLKALHVAAALVFTGGVLGVSMTLLAMPGSADGALSFARAIHRWDRAVTTPAMLFVFAFGLALATAGHLFADRWLQAKLIFVLLLSIVHGLQSGRLRRLAGGAAAGRWRAVPVILACLLAIVVLAVVKP